MKKILNEKGKEIVFHQRERTLICLFIDSTRIFTWASAESFFKLSDFKCTDFPTSFFNVP